MQNRTYLDHAATTPMRGAAIEAMTAELTRVGNPSSLHGSGRDARRVVEESRELIADNLGADPAEVIFTSGATEADNLMITGSVRSTIRHRGGAGTEAAGTPVRVITSAVEHHAVLETAQALAQDPDIELELVGVDAAGRLDLDRLRGALDRAGEVACLSIIWANNETGVLQPIPEIVRIGHAAGVPVHSDAVQLVGQLPVDFHGTGLDAMSLSAHKFGGPVGVGALLARRDLALAPVQHGGGQERDLRSGTVDVAGVAGFAAALELATTGLNQQADRLRALRDRMINSVLAAVDGVTVNGTVDADASLPTIANLSFTGCEADNLLMLLDQAGIDTSTGSACTAGVSQPSHVLEAMGRVGAQTRSSLRFSLGHTSTDADVDRLLQVLPDAVARARRAGVLES